MCYRSDIFCCFFYTLLSINFISSSHQRRLFGMRVYFTTNKCVQIWWWWRWLGLIATCPSFAIRQISIAIVSQCYKFHSIYSAYSVFHCVLLSVVKFRPFCASFPFNSTLLWLRLTSAIKICRVCMENTTSSQHPTFCFPFDLFWTWFFERFKEWKKRLVGKTEQIE